MEGTTRSQLLEAQYRWNKSSAKVNTQQGVDGKKLWLKSKRLTNGASAQWLSRRSQVHWAFSNIQIKTQNQEGLRVVGTDLTRMIHPRLTPLMIWKSSFFFFPHVLGRIPKDLVVCFFFFFFKAQSQPKAENLKIEEETEWEVTANSRAGLRNS